MKDTRSSSADRQTDVVRSAANGRDCRRPSEKMPPGHGKAVSFPSPRLARPGTEASAPRPEPPTRGHPPSPARAIARRAVGRAARRKASPAGGYPLMANRPIG